MTMFAIITLLAVGNLAHRLFLLPALPLAFDSWGHLYFTMEVKRARSGPFRPLYPRVAGSAAFYYPLFVHWLYSFLPEAVLRRYTAWINPVLETLFLAAVLALFHMAGFSRELIVVAGAGYILTPLWFSKAAFGPRVLYFTTRLASEAVYPLALAIVLLDLGLPAAMTIPIAAILFAVILLGSKFGVQVMFLVTPITAALAGSWSLAIAGGLSFIMAFLVSRGAFGKQLNQQVAHLTWYIGELRNGSGIVLDRNKFSDLIPRSMRLTNDEFKKLAFGWLGRNSFTAVLLKSPHIVLTPVLAIAFWDVVDVPREVWAPVAAAVIVYLLINLPWLLFLGEAERYPSHVSIFTNLLFALICLQTGMIGLAVVLGIYGLVFTLAERLALRKPLNPAREREADLVIDYLNRRPDRRMVLPVPFGAVAPFRILLDTGHGTPYSVLSGVDHQKAMKGLETFLYADLLQWDRLAEVTGVDLLVISDNALPEQIRGWQPPAAWRRIDGDFGDLRLYELSR